MMKTIAFIHEPDASGAVGDFAPVTSVFSHYQLGNTISPFLLLDHLGPGYLKPTQLRKGVSEHPHRGFETITMVYAGEIAHRDSTGGGGVIQAGDVQWMTAGSGVLHEELFSDAFSQQGGSFEFLQLWVNLPAKDKMNPARYQHLTQNQIPKFVLENESYVRVIAGQFEQSTGPATTHTPMQVFDVYLKAGESLVLPAAEQHTTLMYLLRGQMQVMGSNEVIETHQMAVMSNQGENVHVQAVLDTQFLYLSAQPLNEPIYARGYFVMNTFSEVLQAYEDLKNHQFIQK